MVHIQMAFCSGTPKWESWNCQSWGTISLWAKLQWRWGLKQSCSLRQKFSNNMLHPIYRQGNRVDSRLLMVGSQTANLTFDPSFGYNLCFRCANEECKPISDIYVPRAFQWYKERFKPLNFDPCNRPLKIWESSGTPFPKWELPWECEGSLPHTSLHSREHAVWFVGFLLARNLATPLLWSRAQG